MNNILYLEPPRHLETEDIFGDAPKLSMWTIEGEVIRPSTNVSVRNKLAPGMYRVDYHREFGMFCKKLQVTSDELYNFSDSKIPSLLEEINNFWDKADLYAKNKLVHKRGILLPGFGGTGKSSIVTLLCNEIIKRDGVIFKVANVQNLSIYVEFIKNSFRSIEPNTPVITVIEDLDRYVDDDSLLDFLDGKTSIDHHVVIATTNNSKAIPEVFLRPSRIDLIIEVGLPAAKVREEYFVNKGVPEELINQLVNVTEGRSLAELKELYISIFLLGYSIEDGIKKLTTKTVKKDYTSNDLRHNKIAI